MSLVQVFIRVFHLANCVLLLIRGAIVKVPATNMRVRNKASNQVIKLSQVPRVFHARRVVWVRLVVEVDLLVQVGCSEIISVQLYTQLIEALSVLCMTNIVVVGCACAPALGSSRTCLPEWANTTGWQGRFLVTGG